MIREAHDSRTSPSPDPARTSQRFRLRTENARERDVFRHLHPWMTEHKGSGIACQPFSANAGDHSPRACHDTALVAFAQLCALRLRTARCFVSLISSSTEYVLVESTRTMSLQYETMDNARDIPWIGTCNFPRDDGLNTLALETWRKAHHLRDEPEDPGIYYTEGITAHWQIISEVRGDNRYAARALVKRHPSIRFFASVPLRGASGSVIGSLSIVDDVPRYGLSPADIALMEEIADTITEHLDATIVRGQRRRSERLIQSLSLFNSGHSSLRHWWLKQEDIKVSNAARHKAQKLTSSQRHAAADKEFGYQEPTSASDTEAVSNGDNSNPTPPVTLANGEKESYRTEVRTLNGGPPNVQPKPSIEPSQASSKSADSRRNQQPVAKISPKQHFRMNPERERERGDDMDQGTATKRMYARASNLMREALDADGVVFVDCTTMSSRTTTSDTGTGSNHVSDGPERSDTDASDGPRSCNVEAFATRTQSSVRGMQQTDGFDLSDSFMASLLRRYPQGRIFNFKQDGTAYASSSEESMNSGSNSDARTSRASKMASKDGQKLGKILPDATTIAFFPLWNPHNNRWCSSMFVWSSSPLYHFDEIEHLTYLASWSHSILSDLSRLHTIAADTAKETFISSVSHELRSPLHGVLGSVEFLQETNLTGFQREMAQTISMASKMLLGTVNHILDYSKISSFSRSKKRSPKRKRPNANTLPLTYDGNAHKGSFDDEVVTSVDFARLTEDIVETVASAYRFENSQVAKGDEVSLTLNVPWRENWLVELQPDLWTRILHNLVGNSLKYTKQGVVSVRVVLPDSPQNTKDTQAVRLVVQDTGIGISDDFLSHGLYVPFRQEDPNSTGTGLGLSIVQQICKDMGARLSISSKRGVGTRATVDFVIRLSTSEIEPDPEMNDPALHSRDLNVHNYHWIKSHLDTPSTIAVGNSVSESAVDWLDCDHVMRSALLEAGNEPVVCTITEDELLDLAKQGGNVLQAKLDGVARPFSHVLVLARSLSSTASSISSMKLPFTPVIVHQPIGPRKLIRVITSDQNSSQLSTMDENQEVNRTDSEPAPVDHALFEGTSRGRQLSEHTEKAWSNAADTSEPHSRKSSTSDTDSAQPFDSISSPTSTVASSMAGAACRSQGACPTPSGTDPTTDGRADTVLLVEDNDVNMRLLVTLMRKLSVPFVSAADGQQAVEAYCASPSRFFLVLMDMSMPVMDGFEATSKIRDHENQAQLPRCAIVALTGVTSEEAKGRAFDSGIDEFFSKPVRMNEVKQLLARFRKEGG